MDHTLRMVCDNMVLLRVTSDVRDDDFIVDGRKYPAVVALDTTERKVRIYVRQGVMMDALAIGKQLWGQAEGDARMARSPEGIDMYIMDARKAAEYIRT